MFRQEWKRSSESCDEEELMTQTKEIVPDSQNSASVETFRNFLLSGKSGFRNYLVVILGHGGRIHEICPDEYPTNEHGQEALWMNTMEIAEALHIFNMSKCDGRLRLIFLQNCCKSSLSVIQNFSMLSSVFVLASQTILSAPNHYYIPLLKSLFANPTPSGLEVAKRIVGFEPDSGYSVMGGMEMGYYKAFSMSFNNFLGHVLAALSSVRFSPEFPSSEILMSLRVWMMSYFSGGTIDRFVDLMGLASILYEHVVTKAKQVEVELDCIQRESLLTLLGPQSVPSPPLILAPICNFDMHDLHESWRSLNQAISAFIPLRAVSPRSAYPTFCGLNVYFPFGLHGNGTASKSSSNGQVEPCPQGQVKGARGFPFSTLADVEPQLDHLFQEVPHLHRLFDLFREEEGEKQWR